MILEFAVPAFLAAAAGLLGLGRGRAYIVIAFAGAGCLAIVSLLLFPLLGQLMGTDNPRIHAGWSLLTIAAGVLSLLLLWRSSVPVPGRVLFGIVGAAGLATGGALTTRILVEAGGGATYSELQPLADFASPIFIAVLGGILIAALVGAAASLVTKKP